MTAVDQETGPPRCAACGEVESGCTCEQTLDRLKARARELANAGGRAATDRLMLEATNCFKTAVLFDASLGDTWLALGLCLAGQGDLPQAVRAWRRAAALEPRGRATELLDSCNDGSIAKAVRHHNLALELARSGELDSALTEAEQALREIPALLPAIRLSGLLRWTLGDGDQAVAVWREGAARYRDDTVIAQYLGSAAPHASHKMPAQSATVAWGSGWRSPVWAAVSAAVVFGLVGALVGQRFTESKTEADAPPVAAQMNVAAESDPGGATSLASSPAEVTAAVLEWVRGSLDRPEAVAALLTERHEEVATWSEEEQRLSIVALQDAGWRRYRAGRAAVRAGDDEAAVGAFEEAIDYGREAFYVDDALFETALAAARDGNVTQAREVASVLLRDHPTSMFANSLMRELATATSGEPDND